MSLTTPRARIVVADDDSAVADSTAAILREEGYEVDVASNAGNAIAQVRANAPDLAILDLRMPGMPTMDSIPALLELDPNLSILIVTGFGSIELAVRAVRAGAADFIEKPLRREVFLTIVAKALEHRTLKNEVRRLRADRAQTARNMVGGSPSLLQLKAQIARVANARDTTVLIRGESGAGKELVARAIHAESSRAAGPFVAINCAALSGPLLEAELFGYESGSFTGADRAGREGLFEQAASGTLFFDEIGELDPALQSKLLRVLEDRTVRRVGAVRDRRTDVRVLAATHRNIETDVASGRFREDLYYRLAVVTVHVPALRERRGDIPAIACDFLQKIATSTGRKHLVFRTDAMEALMQHRWPGNVRELRNAVERACIVREQGEITPADLGLQGAAWTTDSMAPGASCINPAAGLPTPSAVPSNLADTERIAIERALAACGGNISSAARLLGVHRTTLHRKLSQFREAPAPVG